MKTECDVIRDLLPLYVEDMVSNKSKELIEEHLAECTECRGIYEKMITPEPQIQANRDEAKSFHAFVKKEKRIFGWKVGLLTAAVIIGILVIRFAFVAGVIGFLGIDGKSAEITEDTDIENYGNYMGVNADKEYRDKWGMDESIFPERISSDMKVKDYKMVYYNPWDAQYLSYLVVDYDKEHYIKEMERLKNLGTENYEGYYGADGFNEKYELAAMNADETYGFIYALSNGSNEIVYVEIIFCNYFMDFDYKQYINSDYLPQGFDAAKDNPYREKMLK